MCPMIIFLNCYLKSPFKLITWKLWYFFFNLVDNVNKFAKKIQSFHVNDLKIIFLNAHIKSVFCQWIIESTVSVRGFLFLLFFFLFLLLSSLVVWTTFILEKIYLFVLKLKTVFWIKNILISYKTSKVGKLNQHT